MTAPKRRAPRVPAGLADKGAAFWRDVVGSYELRVDELVLLEHACRAIDELERLAGQITESNVLVTGSRGQVRPHPLLKEQRESRVLLARLLRQLKLPDPTVEAAPKSRSVQARAAAQTRWALPSA